MPGATPAEFSGDLERDASGNLYMTAGDFVGKHYVVKATPTGAIATTFSGDGVAPMPGTAFDMVLDTSGRPVAYSPNLAPTDDGPAWELTRLTTSGALDATYGVGGVALVPVPDGISIPSDVAMAGNIGYFPTCLCPDGGASTPAVVALDVAAADLVDGFDGDGVARSPAAVGRRRRGERGRPDPCRAGSVRHRRLLRRRQRARIGGARPGDDSRRARHRATPAMATRPTP